MTALADLRSIGLAMGTRYAPTSLTDPETQEDRLQRLHVGYTTDQEKAKQAGELGATVTRCGGKTDAWEITVRVIES